MFWTRLTARGRAAHAGDPEAGDSAILRMTRLIETLQRELGPRLTVRRRGGRKSTMNIGTIRGGHNTNAVPSECVIEIDRRTLAEEKVADAFAEMEAALATSGEPAESYAFEFLTGTNGFASAADAPCIAAFHRAIERVTGEPPRELIAVGASDGRYFADDGIEILTFGPGAARRMRGTWRRRGKRIGAARRPCPGGRDPLVPGIHVLRRGDTRGDRRGGGATWMPGTSPGMTERA